VGGAQLAHVEVGQLLATKAGRQQRVDDGTVPDRAAVTVDIPVGGRPAALELVEPFQPVDHALQRADLGSRECPRLEWGKPDRAGTPAGIATGQRLRRLRPNPGQESRQ